MDVNLSDKATALPRKGVSLAEIQALVKELKAMDTPMMRLNANSMKGSEEVQKVAKEIFAEYFAYNAMYSTMIPSMGRMEDELLAICVEIFNGGANGRANLTSGGTESIFCAMHAMREWAKAEKNISEPQLIIPYSAHAAFSKACHYLGIQLIRTPLGKDFRADVDAMHAAIGPNTVGVVASAPCWPYGLFDPISAINDLAVEKGLWLHVDACLGGYLSPFVRKAGYPIPDFDFTLSGVRSISADLHKYGHAPKPISTVMWRSEQEQQYHYYLVEDWPTGTYFTQSLGGSRPAGPMAAAWAIFKFLGEEGKVELARKTMEVKERLAAGVREIDGLRVFENELTPFLFFSDANDLDITRVVGGLFTKGWLMLGTPDPPLAQITLDAVENELVDQFLSDLSSVVKSIRAGEDVPSVALSYTFDKDADISSSPIWAQQAISILERNRKCP